MLFSFLLVVTAKSVGKEIFQRNLFLFYKSRLRNLALTQEIQHRTNTGGGSYLDCATQLAVYCPAIDLIGIGLL